MLWLSRLPLGFVLSVRFTTCVSVRISPARPPAVWRQCPGRTTAREGRLAASAAVHGSRRSSGDRAQYPWKELAWDQAHCRYLMGLYYGTWPWMREFVNVTRLGLPLIKLWAYDHIRLFAWPLPLPTADDRSFMY